MYRRTSPEQPSFKNFYLPFGGKLSSDNRWVKLAKLIPWEEFEQSYAAQFSARMGAPAKPFRMALGSLIIKERLGVSDAETVEQIRENPYLQYLIGLSEDQEHGPFEASMMVHFRKRLNIEVMAAINEAVVQAMLCPPPEEAEPVPASEASEESPPETTAQATSAAADVPSAAGEHDDNNDNDDDPEPPPNAGQLILDATCAPADIRYPTDLDLLNQARQWSERLIDALYASIAGQLERKPRTYRQVARRRYLAIARRRKPSRRLIRKGIGQQLRYLRRNLAHIDHLVESGAALGQLPTYHYRMLLVIAEVYRQQHVMYEGRTHTIEHRIVSLQQPHVRPIVRGKARTPVEFGAKLTLSCVRGCVFLDHLSWENFNESTWLQQQAERFRTRFGHYPASIHADQIYRTRDNLRWCKQRGIRLSGPPLGRPTQDERRQAALKQQARADEAVRVEIEGKFGQAKRRFGLGRVMSKLAQTAQTAIAITVLVLNLERWLRCLLVFLLWLITHMLVPLEPKSAFQRSSNPMFRQQRRLSPCHA
jgi:hypothetical protein